MEADKVGSVSCESNKKRARSRSSSSESVSKIVSNESSSTSENSYSSPRRGRKARKYSEVSDVHLSYLSQQVAFLTNLITQKSFDNPCAETVVNSGCDQQLQNKDNGNNLILHRPFDNCGNSNQVVLSELTTAVKDPVYIKANENFLTKLSQLQRFKCDDWYAIRFMEAQKKYLATPGFIELSVNDELKRCEVGMLNDDPRAHLLERSFAALTHAVILQKEELQNNLQALINWSCESKNILTPDSLFEKVSTLFTKESSYSKVTDDLLQIICGRRADLINLRRESILKQIPDEFQRNVLQKFRRPSSHCLIRKIYKITVKKLGVEKLFTTTRPMTQSQYKEKNYQNPKPSTSKQSDDAFFRQNNSKKGKQFRPRNQSHKGKIENKRSKDSQKGNKSRYTSYKNKRRE